MFRRIGVFGGIFSLVCAVCVGVFGVSIASAGSSGSISGTVTAAAGGADLPGVCVIATSHTTSTSYQATTAGNGTYTINNLPLDSYIVEFDPTCTDSIASSYALQYYPNDPDFGEASLVPVTSTSSPSGISAALAPSASISGTVSVPASAHAPNAGSICVGAYAEGDGYFVNLAITNNSGTYDITNLPANSYIVVFEPTCFGLQVSDFGTWWYNGGGTGTASYTNAETLAVTSGESVTNINNILTFATLIPSVSTSSLTSVTATQPYSQAVQAVGGTTPYTWIASGLPSGLSISSAGQITGTPTQAGTYTISVTAADASTPTAETSASLSLVVGSAPTPTTTTTLPPSPPVYIPPARSTPAKSALSSDAITGPATSVFGSAATYTIELGVKKGKSAPTGRVSVTYSKIVTVTTKVKGKSVTKKETKVFTIASGSLSKGDVKLSFNTSALGVGSHTLSFVYAGNNKYKTKTETKHLTVNAKK